MSGGRSVKNCSYHPSSGYAQSENRMKAEFSISNYTPKYLVSETMYANELALTGG